MSKQTEASLHDAMQEYAAGCRVGGVEGANRRRIAVEMVEKMIAGRDYGPRVCGECERPFPAPECGAMFIGMSGPRVCCRAVAHQGHHVDDGGRVW